MAQQTGQSVTIEQLIQQLSDRFATAHLDYGHGTDNPVDEAAWLVFAHLDLSHDEAPAVHERTVSSQATH
jgi:ribosomal protein L3 glutamine methyltransferase